MEENKKYTLQFENNEDVVLEYIGMLHGKEIFETIRYGYDVEQMESSTLTVRIEIAPMTERERRIIVLKQQDTLIDKKSENLDKLI